MVYLTRKEHFNAAHKLHNPSWSDEKNEAVFGKCANNHFHGHNYDLYVTVKGEPSPDTGYIIDVKELGGLMREHITTKLDHKNLNTQVDFLKGIMPTTENLAKAIYHQLQPHLNGIQIHCVKLVETETIYVEYYGE